MMAGMLEGQAEALSKNPWDYIANLLIEVGSLLLLLGVALGFIGFYLKAYSVKAKGDAAQGIATVEGVFGNVSFSAAQQPYLSITTPNLANDVVNLGNDAWRFLGNTAGSAWADLKGVATAVDDIPKALVQLVSQGPGIAINGFLGLVSEALADIFILIFPYAIIFGGGMLAAGVGMVAIRYVWDAYLAPEFGQWADLHLGAPLRSWTHRLLGNPSPPVTSPISSAPMTSTYPGSEGQASTDESGKAGGLPERLLAPASPEASTPHPTPENPPAAVSVNPEVSSTAPETLPAVSTEEQEQSLGDQLTTAKDRMRAALRRRREAPARKEEDYVGWAYARIPASA